MRSPSPGPPRRFARGTRQSSKRRVTVDEARIPILSSRPATARPGAPRSTTRAVIAPRGSSISDHLPKTRRSSETSPLEMNVFSPVIATSSPSGTKRVRIAVASEPAVGSVMTSEPRPPRAMRGRRRAFCSGEPKSMRGFMPWKVVA